MLPWDQFVLPRGYRNTPCNCQANPITPAMRPTCSWSGRTETLSMLYSLTGVTSPHHLSPAGPLNPSRSWPSKIKSRRTVPLAGVAKSKSYRALPPQAPVPSAIASGVVSRERTDGGSAGRRAHVLLSSLPVSLLRLKFGTNVCANTRLIFPIAGLNLLVVFIPLAWVSYFNEWEHVITFSCMLLPFAFLLYSQDLFPVCFLGIVSLEKMFDWGGEQLAMYCGPDLGDLIIITLNKYCLLY